MSVIAAIPGMRRINHRVDQCSYAADVGVDGIVTVDIPAMPAALVTGIINAASVAALGVVGPVVGFNAASLGRYGRNLTVALSGAGTGNLTLYGYDWLGQAIKETIALAGATPVLSKKMFADFVSASFPVVGAVTLNVGWGNVLGVPYKVLHTSLLGEMTSDVTAAAGALVAGVSPQTLTSGDPRGTYTPAAAPDGVRTYRFSCFVDRSNLHGAAHVTA